MATTENVTFGICVAVETEYGMSRLVARIMRREGAAEHPLNCGSLDEGKFDFNGLQLSGFVSDYGDRSFFQAEPGYLNAYCVDMRRAARMLKTLEAIDRRIRKDQSREHGDVFMSFAKAIGASWVVVETDRRGTFLRDSGWRWLSVPEGRDLWRSEIEKFRKSEIEKKPAVA